jgi:hypothetical protein
MSQVLSVSRLLLEARYQGLFTGKKKKATKKKKTRKEREEMRDGAREGIAARGIAG